MYSKINKSAVAIFLLCAIFISCKRDNFNGLDSISSQLPGSSMVSYVQKGAMITFNGTNYNFITSYVGVPVTLKKSAKQQDTVKAIIDTSLVAAYNSIYSEKNPAFPSSAFKVSHNGVFPINPGSTQAIDSLYITLNDASKLKTKTTYLIPIKLQSKIGSELSYTVFFIKMTVTISDLRSKMDFANTWNSGYTPYWRSGSLFVLYSVSSDSKGVMIGPDSVRFSVALNSAFAFSNVKVEAEVAVDDSTINAYSAKTYTQYQAFPEGTYELKRNIVNILAKSQKSKDSLSVVIKNKAKFNRSTWYLLGLKLKKSINNPLSVAPLASDSARAYISFYIN